MPNSICRDVSGDTLVTQVLQTGIRCLQQARLLMDRGVTNPGFRLHLPVQDIVDFPDPGFVLLHGKSETMNCRNPMVSDYKDRRQVERFLAAATQDFPKSTG